MNSLFLLSALFTVTPYLAVEETDLQWNIAGTLNGDSPNILSELSYRDMQVYTTGLASRIEIPSTMTGINLILLSADISAGRIQKGEQQDSDYLGDNRSFEFSRSLASISGDKLRRHHFSLGIELPLDTSQNTLVFQIGQYSLAQDMRITDGLQVISRYIDTFADIPNGTGPFAGLNSSYDFEWDTIWYGVTAQLPYTWGVLRLKAEYHDGDYNATANWNLRDDFAHPVSFTHRADGDGKVLSINFLLPVFNTAQLTATYRYEKWSTDAGIDTIYFADGSAAFTQLNIVEAKSSSVQLGLLWTF